MRLAKLLLLSLLLLACGASPNNAQQPSSAPPQPPRQPNLTEWRGAFTGTDLDAKVWERYSLEGGATVKVADNKLHLRGSNGSRSGVRTVPAFNATRFVVNAKLAKVAAGIGDPGATGIPTGNAILVVLFEDTGTNRIEWILTTEGRLEAWLIRDGKSERLDTRNRGTKETAPTLGLARRGDDFYFLLNGEIGLQKTIKNMPPAFRVMLYGYSNSQNEWEWVSVVTPQT